MKSVIEKPAGKKTKRVATVFTGAAALGAAFGPAALTAPAAQATPANAPLKFPESFVIWVNTSPLVYSLQVCGYKFDSPIGEYVWRCTTKEHNPWFSKVESHANFMGHSGKPAR
jgi:hypothetical protein